MRRRSGVSLFFTPQFVFSAGLVAGLAQAQVGVAAPVMSQPGLTTPVYSTQPSLAQHQYTQHQVALAGVQVCMNTGVMSALYPLTRDIYTGVLSAVYPLTRDINTSVLSAVYPLTHDINTGVLSAVYPLTRDINTGVLSAVYPLTRDINTGVLSAVYPLTRDMNAGLMPRPHRARYAMHCTSHFWVPKKQTRVVWIHLWAEGDSCCWEVTEIGTCSLRHQPQHITRAAKVLTETPPTHALVSHLLLEVRGGGGLPVMSIASYFLCFGARHQNECPHNMTPWCQHQRTAENFFALPSAFCQDQHFP